MNELMTNKQITCPSCEMLQMQPIEWEGGETWDGKGDKYGWYCWGCHLTLPRRVVEI